MLMVGDPDVVAKDARGYCTVPVAPVMVEEREDMFGEAVFDEHVVPEGEAHEPPGEGLLLLFRHLIYQFLRLKANEFD